MTGLSVFHSYAEEFETRLRLKTFPLAVKLLEKEEDIPERAIRPKKDLGHHIALCVALSMSRREGTILAMLKEDMWCFDPVIGLGLAEPPEYFLEGYNRFPESARTLEAGKNWACAFPRLKCGKYIGIMSAPLKTANFAPDLIIIYCDSAQLTQLLMAANCKDGRDITSRLSSVAACVYATIPTMQSREYQVTPPCAGDSRHAMSQDNEIIFTAPIEKAGDLITGLRYLEEHNNVLPRALTVELEYKLSEKYEKIGKMLGMDI